MPIPRMRLLKDAAAEVKKLDPRTAVTPYFIRKLAIEGKVKSTMAGRKRLINFDDLLDYLNQLPNISPEDGNIRRIG